MAFIVTKIIDGDTFEVAPKWVWNQFQGTIVRPCGYNTPEKGQYVWEGATIKLINLLLNKEVELKNPKDITYGRLLCEVFINGKNLAEYFKEYKV